MVRATAVCAYDSDPADPSSISIVKGATVNLISSDGAWTVVETAAGARGCVPRQCFQEHTKVEVPVSTINVPAPPISSVSVPVSVPSHLGSTSVPTNLGSTLSVPTIHGSTLTVPTVPGTHVLRVENPAFSVPSASSVTTLPGTRVLGNEEECQIREGVPGVLHQQPSTSSPGTRGSQKPLGSVRRLKFADDHPEDDLLAEAQDNNHGLLVLQEALNNEVRARTEQSVQVRSTMKQLQDDLAAFKTEAQDNHCSLRDTVTYFTKQVDNLQFSLAEQCGQRVQAEERLGKVCEALRSDLETAMQESREALLGEIALCRKLVERKNAEQSTSHYSHISLANELELRVTEQQLGKACNDLRSDLQTAMQDANTALRLELASQTKLNNNALMSAMQEANASLQNEFQAHRSCLDFKLEEHDALHEGHVSSLNDLEQKIHKRLKEIFDGTPGDKQQGPSMSQPNSYGFLKSPGSRLKMQVFGGSSLDEDGTPGARRKFVFAESSSQPGTREESTAPPESGARGDYKRLSDLVTDLTKQVDKLKSASAEESGSLARVEDRLEKSCSELRSDLAAELKEVHSALRIALSDHGRKSDEAILALQEAHQALESELATHSRGLEGRLEEHDALHKGHTSSMDEFMQKLRSELQKVSDSHHALHAESKRMIHSFKDEQNAKHAEADAAREAAFHSVQYNGQTKLQEELLALRAEIPKNDGCDTLQGIVTGLVTQVDTLTSSYAEDSVLRAQAEEHLGKACDTLRGDLQTIREALQIEFAEHRKNSDDQMSAAVQEVRDALQQELTIHVKGVEGRLGDYHTLHQGRSSSVDDLEQRMRSELQKVSDGHHAQHADVKADVRTLIQSINDEHHARLAKVQQAFAELSGKMIDNHAVQEDALKKLQKAHEDLQKEMALNRGWIDPTLKEADDRIKKAMGELRDEMNEKHAGHADMMKNLSTIHADLKAELKDELGKHKDEHEAALKDADQKVQQALAEFSGNMGDKHAVQEDALKKLQKAHEELQKEMALNKGSIDPTLKEADDRIKKAMGELKDEMNGKHAGHADMMKNFSTAHADLRAELKDELGKHKDEHEAALRDADQRVQQALAEFSGKMGDKHAVQEDALKKLQRAHEELQKEMAFHKGSIDPTLKEADDRIKKAMGELKDEMNEKHASHADMMKNLSTVHADLKAELKGELRKHKDEHKAALADADKKAEEAREVGLQNVYSKLQGELSALKRAADDNLKDIVTNLMDQISKQKSSFDQVEERVGKALGDAHSSLDSATRDSHSALQVELADQRRSLEGKLDEQAILHEGHKVSIRQLEQRIRDELQQVSDCHHELHAEAKARHAKAEEAREAGLESVLDSVHSKLLEEFSAIKRATEDNLQDVVTDLTAQVNHLTSSFVEESTLRAQVEERLGKALDEIHGDLQSAAGQVRAALQVELQAELQEAHGALQRELAAHIGRLEVTLGEEHADLKSLVKSMNDDQHAKHAKAEDLWREGLQTAIQNIHSQLHEEVAALLLEADNKGGKLQDVVTNLSKQLDSLQSFFAEESGLRVQLEEWLVKSSNDLRRDIEVAMREADTSLRLELAEHSKDTQSKLHGELAVQNSSFLDSVTDLTKQVDTLRSTFADESVQRVQVEDRAGKVCDDLRSALERAMHEKHAALRDELADHVKAHKALQSELGSYERHLEKHTSLHDSHASSIEDLEQRLRNELQSVAADHRLKHEGLQGLMSSIDKEHHARHTKVEEAQEACLESLVQRHAKLLEDVATLRSGATEDHGALQDVVKDLTKQVDNLTSSLEKESGLRDQAERRLNKACDDLLSGQEAHEALRSQLAEHSKSREDQMSVMEAAQQALQSELATHIRSLEGKLDEQIALHERHASSMNDMEQRIRNELQKPSDSSSDSSQERQVDMKDFVVSNSDDHHAKSGTVEEVREARPTAEFGTPHLFSSTKLASERDTGKAVPSDGKAAPIAGKAMPSVVKAAPSVARDKSWATAMKAFNSAEKMAAKVASNQSTPILGERSVKAQPANPPMATVPVDMQYDGQKKVVHYTGVDLNNNGIPDALETAPGSATPPKGALRRSTTAPNAVLSTGALAVQRRPSVPALRLPSNSSTTGPATAQPFGSTPARRF